MKSYKTLATSLGLALTFPSCKSTTTDVGTQLKEAESSASESHENLPIGSSRFYFGIMDTTAEKIYLENGVSVDYNSMHRQFGISPEGGAYKSQIAWPCQDVESWLIGKKSKLDPSLYCMVLLRGTGRIERKKPGAAYAIYSTDRNGNGVEPTSEIPSAPSGLTIHQPSDGPPRGVNLGVNRQAFVNGMNTVRMNFWDSAYRPADAPVPRAVIDCLSNAKTSVWSDIQAHYYCALSPNIRGCYSLKLEQTRSPKEAWGYCSNPKNKDDWMTKMKGTFVEATGPGNLAWEWLMKAPGQAELFVSIMMSRPESYNIESANEAINAWYRKLFGPDREIHKIRVLRAIDTYKYWTPNQPRYEKIRALQSSGR